MLFRESLPSVPFYIYFLNRFQGSVEGIKPYEPMSKLGLLIDSPKYISQEDTICDCLDFDDEAEQNSCMDTAYEKYNADNLLTAEWFAQCWQKAGGKDFKIPAFLTEEDAEFKPINLKTGKHIKHSSEYSNVFDG
ncbi:MAG: hypothetical protein L3J51_03890 [Cocleimonas sp.]|nr:hypothetical protein [Cocleimonas sp.]